MKQAAVLICLFAFFSVKAEVLDSIYYYDYKPVAEEFVIRKTENFRYRNGLVSRRHTDEYDTTGKLFSVYRNNYSWLEKDFILSDTLEKFLDMKTWVLDSCTNSTYYSGKKLLREETAYRRNTKGTLGNARQIYYEYDNDGRRTYMQRDISYPFTSVDCYQCTYTDTSAHELWNDCVSLGSEMKTVFDELDRPKYAVSFASLMEHKPDTRDNYYYYNDGNDSIFIWHTVKYYDNDKNEYWRETYTFENGSVKILEYALSLDSLNWDRRNVEYTRSEKYYRQDIFDFSEEGIKTISGAVEEIYNDNGNIVRRNHYRYPAGIVETEYLTRSELYVYAEGNSVEGNIIAEHGLKYLPAENAILIPEGIPYQGAKMILVSLQGIVTELEVNSDSVPLSQNLTSGIYVAFLTDAEGRRVTSAITLPLVR